MARVRARIGLTVRLCNAGGLWQVWDSAPIRGHWWITPADDVAAETLAQMDDGLIVPPFTNVWPGQAAEVQTREMVAP